MTTRVGLLQVGHIDPKSRHIAGDYPQLFQALLAEHDIEVVPYNVIDDGRWPTSLDECGGWIMSPSRNSVYDDVEWIKDAEEVVRELVATERPFVGVCFGHQLLAQALGGKVERHDDGWAVGVQTYDVIEQYSWMRPPVDHLRLIASHEDQVVDVPAGTSVWATSAFCPVAGLAAGERALTIQAHPEFVPEMADHLLAGRVALIGAERVGAARASLATPDDRTAVAGWIARFLSSAR
jgi:GMP synthase-like glutamine amidotransferase